LDPASRIFFHECQQYYSSRALCRHPLLGGTTAGTAYDSNTVNIATQQISHCTNNYLSRQVGLIRTTTEFFLMQPRRTSAQHVRLISGSSLSRILLGKKPIGLKRRLTHLRRVRCSPILAKVFPK